MDGKEGPLSSPRVSSGIQGLDAILRGGFPEGHSYLIQGRHGAGKTTLGLQFCMRGAREGEKALYLSTCETEAEIREVAASHGWGLEGVTLHHHDPRASFPQGREQSVFHPAEVELPQTMEVILSVIREVKPRRLVVDSLSEIRLLSPEGRWFRRQVLALKDELFKQGCTTLFCDDRLTPEQPVHSIVHGVVDLEQVTPEYGPSRRRIHIAKLRGSTYVSGQHDFRIRTGGMEVYPRLVAAAHRQQAPTEVVSTGLPELDTLFGGGIDRGTATLLLGPSGTGKSTLAAQFALAAADRGESSAAYVFDERVQTLLARAAGMKMRLEERVEEGLVELRQVDPAELTPGEFSQAVRQAVEEKEVRMVIIDSLAGYLNAMPEERRLSLYLHELLSFLNERGVMAILIMTQHGLPGSPRAVPFDVSYISDSVLLFHSFEFAGELRKAISVYKRRAGDHERTLRELRFGEGGVEIGEPLRAFRGITTGTPDFLGESLSHVEDHQGD